MKDTTRKALFFLILSIIIVSTVLFCIAFFYYTRQISKDDIAVKQLRNLVILRYSLVRLIKLLPCLIIFIYITCFSIIFTLSPFQKESLSFNDIAIPSYITLLFLIIITVILELFLMPKLHRDISNLRFKSDTATKALILAKEGNKKGEYQNTIDLLDIYFDIDKQNDEANKLYNNAIKNLSESSDYNKIVETPRSTEEVKHPKNYFEKGKSEYEKEHYYRALFYLERAYDLHKDNREIKSLYERCKQKVGGLLGSITGKEKETKYLIQQKESGINYINKGDCYKAYSIFNKLSRKYPDLNDLKLYLKESEQEILKIDFLPKELKAIEWMPSFDSIVFIDKTGYINTIDFYNIKRYRMNNRSLYFSAKYGKWINDSIRLKKSEKFENISPTKNKEYYIHPYIAPNYLLYINDRKKLLNQLTLWERVNIAKKLRQSGFDIGDKYLYISKRLGVFFSIYICTIILSAFAWSKRSIYDFPPRIKLILFILIVPFLSYFIQILYTDINSIIIYSHRYLTRYILKNLNLAIYTGIINTVFAIISTIYFMMQSGKND